MFGSSFFGEALLKDVEYEAGASCLVATGKGPIVQEP